MSLFKKIFSSGNVQSELPLVVNFAITTPATDLVTVTFDRLVKISSLYMRSTPSAAAQCRVYGDEFGPRAITTGPQTEFICKYAVSSSGATVNSVQNVIVLVQGNNVCFFAGSFWRTRNLYFSASVAGTYVVNLTYDCL